MRPGPATSSPRCCLSASGCWAPSTRTPWTPAATWPTGPGRRGCGRGPGPVRRPAAHPGAGPGPRAPGHPGRPRQPGPLDWAGGGCSRSPRPVRRAAAHPGARPGPRAPDTLAARAYWPAGLGRRAMRPGPATSSRRCCPSGSASSAPSTRHPGRPRQPRPLDRGCGRCGRGPRPVRHVAADPGTGLGPRTPGHPDHSRLSCSLDWGRWGSGRGPDQFAALLPIRERVLGPEHPNTLTSRQPRPLDEAGQPPPSVREA